MRARILKKESEKKAFITQLSNEKRALMFFYEEAPQKDFLYERVSDSITLVHPPYNYETLESGFTQVTGKLYFRLTKTIGHLTLLKRKTPILNRK